MGDLVLMALLLAALVGVWTSGWVAGRARPGTYFVEAHCLTCNRRRTMYLSRARRAQPTVQARTPTS